MKDEIQEYVEDSDDKIKAVNEVKEYLLEVSPVKENPIDCVKWVDLSKVRANDYNPNTVADEEMELLFKSIKEDGYTQPIVTVYHEEEDEYEIVDGFHRYRVMKKYDEISDRSDGRLPITVIDKSVQERMASTVRHNRASGTHGVQGMSEVVRGMKEEGMSDEEICNELGMEAEELARLKHTSGFSKLFDDVDYNNSWQDTRQIDVRRAFEEGEDEAD